MRELEAHDRLPPWPVDLTTKQGQRMLREIFHCLHEELWEASATMRNKVHRLTDDRSFDREHFIEELGDSLAYFMEVCIMSGVSPDEIYDEYRRKNLKVRERLEEGY